MDPVTPWSNISSASLAYDTTDLLANHTLAASGDNFGALCWIPTSLAIILFVVLAAMLLKDRIAPFCPERVKKYLCKEREKSPKHKLARKEEYSKVDPPGGALDVNDLADIDDAV